MINKRKSKIKKISKENEHSCLKTNMNSKFVEKETQLLIYAIDSSNHFY
jgi:hypothetical protein